MDRTAASASASTRLAAALAAAGQAAGYLIVGMGTALLCWMMLVALMAVFVVSMLGVGLPLMLPAIRLLHRFAGWERRRTGRLLGESAPADHPELTGPLLIRVAQALTHHATVREVRWLVVHGFLGVFLGGIALEPAAWVLVPLYWWAAPGGAQVLVFRVDSWSSAVTTALGGLPVVALAILVLPVLARWYGRLMRALLRPSSRVRLRARVAELTATRAAALDAHGAELRRIERDLHDGTQNRIVALSMHLGIAERVLHNDPEAASTLLRRAQDNAMDVLAELRGVIRSIYPPILNDRGLDGAVSALAARCPIPCAVTVGELRRMPAAVEAAAYFVIAESLTNITKHSGAEHATVGLDNTGGTLRIEITDDGHGGATEDQGTGLSGIRRRVAAFDGVTDLSSPPGGPTVLRVGLPCES